MWLNVSKLLVKIKGAVKCAPIELGTVPQERGVEFTAPIAGECLTREHAQMFARVKAQCLLARQKETFKKGAPQKRRA